MKSIYIGMTSVLSAAIIYGFYHLSVIIFHYGSSEWGGVSYIMNRTGGFLYLPLFISLMLFSIGIYFIFKGMRENN